MNLILRRPLMFLGLLLVWLVLTGFTPGQLILGSAVAWIALAAAQPLGLPVSRVRSWGALIRLAGIVALDIIRSNVAVARIILAGPAVASQRSGFLELTIGLRDPNALAILAIILTATPGTAWLDFDRETGRLLLHTLDLSDPEAWRAQINGRYEALLMEAFG